MKKVLIVILLLVVIGGCRYYVKNYSSAYKQQEQNIISPSDETPSISEEQDNTAPQVVEDTTDSFDGITTAGKSQDIGNGESTR